MCTRTVGGTGGGSAPNARRPLSPPGVRVGWLGCFAPPKEGDLGSAAKSWNSREEREFDSPTPGVRAKYPEPSRRKTYNDFE